MGVTHKAGPTGGQLTGATRLFPILGDPIVYVRSPELLTHSFAAHGANAACVPMQVAVATLDAAMAGLASIANIDGLLVTMPHKTACAGHCATLSDRARLLGAVNVMRRNPDRSWHGDMLDGIAFVTAQVDAGAAPAGARVLLVGAGGAGSAIALALVEAGIGELRIHDVDAARAAALVDLLHGHGFKRAAVSAADPSGCAMVCNASPMGMADGDALPVAADRLDRTMFVGDVIAGHGVTPFVHAARQAGCRTAGGDAMVEAVQTRMIDFFLGARDSTGAPAAAQAGAAVSR